MEATENLPVESHVLETSLYLMKDQLQKRTQRMGDISLKLVTACLTEYWYELAYKHKVGEGKKLLLTATALRFLLDQQVINEDLAIQALQDCRDGMDGNKTKEGLEAKGGLAVEGGSAAATSAIDLTTSSDEEKSDPGEEKEEEFTPQSQDATSATISPPSEDPTISVEGAHQAAVDAALDRLTAASLKAQVSQQLAAAIYRKQMWEQQQQQHQLQLQQQESLLNPPTNSLPQAALTNPTLLQQQLLAAELLQNERRMQAVLLFQQQQQQFQQQYQRHQFMMDLGRQSPLLQQQIRILQQQLNQSAANSRRNSVSNSLAQPTVEAIWPLSEEKEEELEELDVEGLEKEQEVEESIEEKEEELEELEELDVEGLARMDAREEPNDLHSDEMTEESSFVPAEKEEKEEELEELDVEGLARIGVRGEPNDLHSDVMTEESSIVPADAEKVDTEPIVRRSKPEESALLLEDKEQDAWESDLAELVRRTAQADPQPMVRDNKPKESALLSEEKEQDAWESDLEELVRRTAQAHTESTLLSEKKEQDSWDSDLEELVRRTAQSDMVADNNPKEPHSPENDMTEESALANGYSPSDQEQESEKSDAEEMAKNNAQAESIMVADNNNTKEPHSPEDAMTLKSTLTFRSKDPRGDFPADLDKPEMQPTKTRTKAKSTNIITKGSCAAQEDDMSALGNSRSKDAQGLEGDSPPDLHNREPQPIMTRAKAKSTNTTTGQQKLVQNESDSPSNLDIEEPKPTKPQAKTKSIKKDAQGKPQDDDTVVQQELMEKRKGGLEDSHTTKEDVVGTATNRRRSSRHQKKNDAPSDIGIEEPQPTKPRAKTKSTNNEAQGKPQDNDTVVQQELLEKQKGGLGESHTTKEDVVGTATNRRRSSRHQKKNDAPSDIDIEEPQPTKPRAEAKPTKIVMEDSDGYGSFRKVTTRSAWKKSISTPQKNPSNIEEEVRAESSRGKKKRASTTQLAKQTAAKKRLVLTDVTIQPTKDRTSNETPLQSSTRTDTNIAGNKEATKPTGNSTSHQGRETEVNDEDVRMESDSSRKEKVAIVSEPEESEQANKCEDLVLDTTTNVESPCSAKAASATDSDSEMESAKAASTTASGSETPMKRRGRKPKKKKEATNLSVIPVLLSSQTPKTVKDAVLKAFDAWQASVSEVQASQATIGKTQGALEEAQALHKTRQTAEEEARQALQAILRKHHRPDRRTKRQKRLIRPP